MIHATVHHVEVDPAPVHKVVHAAPAPVCKITEPKRC